jgi:hypothetical protein
MKEQQHNAKGDLKKRDGYYLAKLRYRGWHIVNKRFKEKDAARQWLHDIIHDFIGSVIQEDIDRMKNLIEETYGPQQGDTNNDRTF